MVRDPIAASPPGFIAGDQIGAYRIVGHLVGNTYRAVEARGTRRVHLDVAPHGGRDWREAAFDMLRAMRMVQSIAHPGVARIIDRGVLVDHRPWLATEVPSGLGLYDLIARRAMPATEATALIHDLAAVLAHAHEKGVVHRALTMRSIVLATGERDYPLVIADWGLPVDELGVYSAPELTGGGELDGRVDVYALGVIAYRAVTQKFPGNAPVIEVPGIPTGLSVLIARMLEPDPAHRLTSIEVRALASELLVAATGDAADVIAEADQAAAAAPELMSFAEDTERHGDDVVHASGHRFGKPKWTPAPPFAITSESAPVATGEIVDTKKPS